MAKNSVVAAVIEKYETLTAANFPSASRPRIDLGEAPQVASSAQLRPPYVVLRDTSGSTPKYDSSFGGTETLTFTLEVYYTSLGDVDTAVKAIKFNGGDPEDQSGLDWGTLALNSPLTLVSLKRTNEKRDYVAVDKDGVRVHRCTLTYEATVRLAPTV